MSVQKRRAQPGDAGSVFLDGRYQSNSVKREGKSEAVVCLKATIIERCEVEMTGIPHAVSVLVKTVLRAELRPEVDTSDLFHYCLEKDV